MEGLRYLAGIPKDPFRIRFQANRADPFPVLDPPGRHRLRMLRRQDRAIRTVENLCRGGAEEASPECSCMGGHDDQVETSVPGKFGNAGRRVSCDQQSWTNIGREVRLKKCIEFCSGNALTV